MTENIISMFYPTTEARFKLLESQNAIVPVAVSLSWHSENTPCGDVGYWRNTRGNVTTGGWYATHDDGSITVRDRLASAWKNYVIPKTIAVYQIPREKIHLFNIGSKVRYIRTEGAVNKYYGMHTVTAIKYIHASNNSAYRYELHMMYESMPIDFVTVQEGNDQRSVSETNHLKYVNTTLMYNFNLCKPPNVEGKSAI